MAANMWKNSLKNVESDNNKILYETLLDFVLQRNGSYFLNKPRNRKINYWIYISLALVLNLTLINPFHIHINNFFNITFNIILELQSFEHDIQYSEI